MLQVMSREVGQRPQRMDHAVLLSDLPWLPCFARRDVLVVQELLSVIQPDESLSMSGTLALASSDAQSVGGPDTTVTPWSAASWAVRSGP